MKRHASSFAALTGALLLAGCATEMGGGSVEPPSVTRFHLGQPIARGAITIEPGDPADANTLEFAQLAAPVERELARLGWTVEARTGRSEQVAVIRVEQSAREAARRSGLSIGVGVGGASYGRHSGVGAGVGGSIPVGGGTRQLVGTGLSVRIQRRSDATVAWEGRAQLEARGGTPLASKAAAVDRLATLLFQAFPGESGRTIRVR
ncbi:MAG TPA: DUF4136 domain-containing protein [Allosphingosinicella sp.]|nr:DUF4136 domain-containing protein [Allosphingosinicella sp.]